MPLINDIAKSEDIGFSSNGHKYIWTACPKCNKKRWVILYKGKPLNTYCNCIKHDKYGDKNPLWKGDKVGYKALHDWIRDWKPKPFACEVCGQKPAYDLANMDGKYSRDLNTWKWLCRTCHMTIDGRLIKLHAGLPERNRKRKGEKTCIEQLKQEAGIE